MSKDYSKEDPHYQRELAKYQNPVPSREFILEYLENKAKLLSLSHLLRVFAIENDDLKEAFRRRLLAMERDGQVMRNRKGSYGVVSRLELIRGRIVGHKDGFGFVIPDEGQDHIFLTPYQMRAVFPGDRVLVKVIDQDQRGRQEGVIVEILERRVKHIVGRFFQEGRMAFVAPTQKEITQDIIIPSGEEGDAKLGQMVVVAIVTQPSIRRQATGRIIEVLGEHMAPGMEVELAIRAYDLPHSWPSEVIVEGDSYQLNVTSSDLIKRHDLRKLPFVTIDGEDAKDFDDAVYCEPRSTGGWRLWVAIADVSHYVRPGSALDQEALKRGNSVYFPNRVVPMLPEILSNELCSLKPNVDRLCMVCEMSISAEGKLTRYHFYEGVIHSVARLTYDEVSNMLEKDIYPDFLSQLGSLYRLYKKLYERRELRCALDFASTETKIIFDDNKKISHILPVIRNDAHRIIEECMLLANFSAASFLLKSKLPSLFRIHAGPEAGKLVKLKELLKSSGLRLTGGEKPCSSDYARLLKRIHGRADEHLLQTILLRSLQQAIYTPDNVGHFGLAYDSYTHFTSPIRRYPDLLVHRSIRYALSNLDREGFIYNHENMINLGQHCSLTERRADEATRDVVDWLKCEYMLDKVGQEFAGIITGVTSFGIFVELKNIYVEGMVHITALKNDYYHFDPIRHYLEGRRTKVKYQLGDSIYIKVVRVDLDNREIDFVLA